VQAQEYSGGVGEVIIVQRQAVSILENVKARTGHRMPGHNAWPARVTSAWGFLLALPIALMGGCKDESADSKARTLEEATRPVVVCTTTMIMDLARQLGQDRVQVIGIIQPGMDPHSYEPTPNDVIWFQKADLILYNGLHLEGRLLDMIKNAGSTSVAVAEDGRIKLRGKAGAEGAPDPHCWWNAKYFAMYVERARDAFISIDAAGKGTYERQAAEYIEELTATDARVRRAIEQIPESQRVLVTSHDAFFYYGEAYGLTVDAVLGISTEAEVRALRAAELARLVARSKVPAVFHETSVSAALNQMVDRVVEIAAGEGHTVRVASEPLYSDSLGNPGTPSGTYVGALLENTRIIVEALSGKPATSLHPGTKDD
jgi:ABC-type Zn uptake system ZnuABC Zn-binding protein ZnuA